MLTFVVRRLLYSIPVLLLASMLVFGFVRSTTDPLQKLRLGNRDIDAVAREEKRLGLDQPLPEQYKRWLGEFTRGDWGESDVSRRDVKSELRRSFWVTLQLIVWAVIVSALTAIAIGVFSAVKQYSVLDYTFTGLSFVGLSMPAFFFGLLAIQLFAYNLTTWVGDVIDLPSSWRPIFYSVGLHSVGDDSFLNYARHLFLPVMTLSVQLVAGWSRYQRSSMLDVLSADYIRTARAKGLPRRKVVLKHGLRNALIPLTTVMAIDIGALFGGLIITETIFSVPGMGRLFVNSLIQGDVPILLPWLMVTAGFIVVFNLLADVVYGLLDPRIRLT